MFIKPQPRGSRRSGMTLMELMVSTAIGTIVMSAVMSLSFYTARSFASLSSYMDLDLQSRITLDTMSRKIREASAVTSYSTNSITFAYGAGSLAYTYDDSAKTLTENDNGTSRVMLENCDEVVFELYQRNTAGGSFDQFTTTQSKSDTKLVKVYWACSDTVLGNLVASEDLTSAKIVLRNQQ